MKKRNKTGGRVCSSVWRRGRWSADVRENTARAETSGRVQTDLDPELGRVRRRGKRGGRAWRPGDQDARRGRVKKASSQMSGLYKE